MAACGILARGDAAGSGHPESRSTPHAECWWKLVWVHQNCHKPELDHERRALMAAAQAVGASLVCLKRAQRFEEWVLHRQRPPFVLLTDRREVAACLEAASEQPPTNRPTFTIVACEGSKQQPDSSAWAQQLGTVGGPVLVHRNTEDVSALLAELTKGLRVGLEGSGPLPSLASSASVRRARPRRASIQDAKVCERVGMPCPTVPCSLAGGDPDERSSLASASTEIPEWQCSTPSSASSSGLDEWWPAWPHPVGEVLAAVCRGRGRSEIERLLLEAMPDHYED